MTTSPATGRSRDDDAHLVSVRSELSPTVVRWALDGNRPAMDLLLRVARTVAVRYCRARIGRRDGSFAAADRLAQEACLAVFATLRDSSARDIPFLAVVYRSALTAVARDRQPHAGDPATTAGRAAELVAVFPIRQRETVILRTVVGLSTTQTAQALGWRTRVVQDVENRAMKRLRASLSARRGEGVAAG